MKKTAFIIGLLLITTISFAQRGNQKWYKTALGLRLEFGASSDLTGISYEQFISNQNSIEFIGLTNFATGAEFTGIYKYIKSLPGIPATVRWYTGIGAHAGSWQGDKLVVGADGLLGIGYTFNDIPLNVTLDWHPKINIITQHDRFIPAIFGLSFKYVVE